MKAKDRNYSAISIFLHWIIAFSVLALFVLGEWMEGLDYYDAWYNRAPEWHRSIGMLLLTVVTVRAGWRVIGHKISPLPTHSHWERFAGKIMHHILDLVTLLVLLSGYFISTAGGKAVSVFGWFDVPAAFGGIEQQESLAGEWHEWLAIALLVLAALHALAALKHHFVDGDVTLKRMCWPRK